MHSLIVLAHPEQKSFNAQMARVAMETLSMGENTTDLSDLYRQGFDPCEALRHFPAPHNPGYFSAQGEQRHASDTGAMPTAVKSEIERLERADLVVLQFPMWWFSMPAMLKGWLDRVFVYGRVYTGSMRYDRGYFKGKRAIVSITTGAPASTHGPDGRSGDMDLLLWPLHFSLHYVGFTVLPPYCSFGVESGIIYSDPETHRARLEGYREGFRDHLAAVDSLKAIKFNVWEDWDETGRLKPGAPVYSPFIRHE